MTHRRTFALAFALIAGSATARPTAAQQSYVADLEVAGAYTGAIDPGVDDLGIHCDDCTIPIDFPFPVRFYGVDYTSAIVSSNGNVQFAGNSAQYQDECLPTVNMDTTLFVLWDDLTLYDAGDGVFTSTTGDAPNRVFNIEWRAHYYGQSGSANFEVRFFENSRNFELVYGVYTGQTYTIGMQRGRGELDRYIRCNFANPMPAGTVFLMTETYTSSRSSYHDAFPAAFTDIGNHCDDCVTPVTFPFPITFYGETYTSANVSSNGNLQFASANADYSNDCLPVPAFGPTIFAHWDDLRTDTPNSGEGVFTNLSGTAPFRTFDVKWVAHYYNGSGSVTFALRFFEGLDYYKLYFLTSDQHGASATIGTQAGDERYGEAWCNTLNAANAGDLYTFSLPPMRVISAGGSVPAGTDDSGNHCDDCTTPLTLPFTVTLFGEEFTSAVISSNGNLQFGSNDRVWINTCLPNATLGTTIFGYWDDLSTSAPGEGVFTRIFGSAPNRLLGIEWRGHYFNTAMPVNFAVILYESIPRFDIYYGALPFGGTSGTVGVQHGGGPEFLMYSCDAAGRLPVSVQFLCMAAPPPCQLAITAEPQDAGACPGGSAMFAVAVSGTDPISCQWQCVTPEGDSCGDLSDGTFTDPDTGLTYDIAGATTPSLTISNIVLGDHPNTLRFAARVTNACGDLASDGAALTIADALTITEQPQDATVCAGDGVSFSVTASGAAPISYQWRHGEVILSDEPDHFSGTTAATLVIINVTQDDAGSYDCIVSDSCGGATSDPATLTVGASCRRGDMNCDGAVNNFDIDPFVLALTNPAQYAAAFPNCNINNGDVNGDGAVNNFDIDPFVACLTAGCP